MKELIKKRDEEDTNQKKEDKDGRKIKEATKADDLVSDPGSSSDSSEEENEGRFIF